jgi:predicted glycosyltransferase involved in capsule biosynthesis
MKPAKVFKVSAKKNIKQLHSTYSRNEGTSLLFNDMDCYVSIRKLLSSLNTLPVFKHRSEIQTYT